MYKTTKADLEQARWDRANPDNAVVKAVVNRMLDKYLVKAIQQGSLAVYLVLDNNGLDKFHTMVITKEEQKAMDTYSGKLVDLVDDLFVDYIAGIVSSNLSDITAVSITTK